MPPSSHPVYAHGVNIPLDHVGHYIWESPRIEAHPTGSLTLETRVIGNGTAEIRGAHTFTSDEASGSRATVEFDVAAFTGTPQLHIINVFSTPQKDGGRR